MLASDPTSPRVVGRSGLNSPDLALMEPDHLGTDVEGARRVEAVRVPGEHRVERLFAGSDGWFGVLRHDVDVVAVELRHLATVTTVDATMWIDERSREIRLEGDGPWSALPALLPLDPFGDTVLSLVCTFPGTVRLVDLPPKGHFARLTAGMDEYGLAVTVLGDGRRVLIQSARDGRAVAVWDALEGELEQVVELHASSPLIVSPEASPTGSLWAASGDTLYELDSSSWEIRFSARLRRQATGCFVGWLRPVDRGATILIGWSRRQPASPWYFEPSAGEVLALDTAARRVERLASFASWTDSACLSQERDHVVAQTDFGVGGFWVAPVERRVHELSPPRRPGDIDWT